MWLLIAFLAVPLIEIALFIQIGSAIGLGMTLLIVVITAVIGTWLVRSQGFMALDRLRQSFSQLNDPTEPLAHGAMILFSGALLLTPGFFTDAVGFALLVPKIRQAIIGHIRSRVKVTRFEMGGGEMRREPHRPDPGVIDGEYTELDRDPPPHDPDAPPSGWTRH